MAENFLNAVSPGAIVIADKAYDTDGICNLAAANGTWANILPRSLPEGTCTSNSRVYHERNLDKRF